MDNTSDTPSKKPNKRKKKDSATDTNDLQTTEIEVSLLASINNKLDLLTHLHQELKDIRTSLEYAHNQIHTVQKANAELHSTVTTLNQQMDTLWKENKLIKEAMLDLQTRNMRDNLIVTGIQKNSPDDSEKSLKDFMTAQLKIPVDTVNSFTFHRVHRLGQKTQRGPRPIIAKFENFKQKEFVRSKGKELKGTHYGLSDQFPKEINERRKILYPLLKDNRKNNKRAYLIIDKLYIDNSNYLNYPKKQ